MAITCDGGKSLHQSEKQLIVEFKKSAVVSEK